MKFTASPLKSMLVVALSFFLRYSGLVHKLDEHKVSQVPASYTRMPVLVRSSMLFWASRRTFSQLIIFISIYGSNNCESFSFLYCKKRCCLPTSVSDFLVFMLGLVARSSRRAIFKPARMYAPRTPSAMFVLTYIRSKNFPTLFPLFVRTRYQSLGNKEWRH